MDKSSSIPAFQQLQQALSAYIRDPEHRTYDVDGIASALPIESRRLNLYENLFFNNIDEIFSNQFPVLNSILGEERWHELLREYMVKHRAKTPLFHELGQEFLLFLQQEYASKPSDPSFMFELAHYEWVEVALACAPELGFDNPPKAVSLDARYELSPLAWYLSYQWPVDQISVDFIPEEPNEPTTLMVYRDKNDKVQFMALSPLLYHLIADLDEHGSSMSFHDIVETLASAYDQPLDSLLSAAKSTLDMLYNANIIRPLN